MIPFWVVKSLPFPRWDHSIFSPLIWSFFDFLLSLWHYSVELRFVQAMPMWGCHRLIIKRLVERGSHGFFLLCFGLKESEPIWVLVPDLLVGVCAELIKVSSWVFEICAAFCLCMVYTHWEFWLSFAFLKQRNIVVVLHRFLCFCFEVFGGISGVFKQQIPVGFRSELKVLLVKWFATYFLLSNVYNFAMLYRCSDFILFAFVNSLNFLVLIYIQWNRVLISSFFPPSTIEICLSFSTILDCIQSSPNTYTSWI